MHHTETGCDSLVARSELQKGRRLETQINFMTNAVLTKTANVHFLFFYVYLNLISLKVECTEFLGVRSMV
jgi:hypothetical protein